MSSSFPVRPFVLLLWLLPAAIASGQSIFSNPITDSDPSTANPYTNGQTVNANMTASGIGRGPGIAANAGSNRYNANSWNTAAIDLTAYFTFTLTPNAGKKINFSSFTFTPQASTTGPTQYAVRTSLDGFTTDIAQPSISNSGSADPLETVSLTGAAFQGIVTAITFRLYGWGASASNGTFSINDFAFNGSVALPVELFGFRAQTADRQTVRLTFSTATEHNNDYFTIERSTDGARFAPIGKVTGAGNSTVQQDYTFTDEHPVQGVNFYRLKQVDFDGQFSYSPIVSVVSGPTGGLRLAPQPAADQLRVTLEQAAAQDGQWQVYDFAGRLLQSGTLEAETADFSVPTASLAAGAYVLRVLSGATAWTRQFQKQ